MHMFLAAKATTAGLTGVTATSGLLILAALAGFSGVALWLHGKWKPVQSICLIAGAAFLAISVTVWTDSLASLVRSVTAVALLIGVTVISGAVAIIGGVLDHKRHHHHIITPVAAMIFGTSLIVNIGMIGTIIKAGLLNPATAAQAAGAQFGRINSGKAAQAGMALPHGQRNTTLLTAVVIIAVASFAIHKFHKRLGLIKTRGGASAVAAPRRGITGPPQQGAVRAAPTRRALPPGAPRGNRK